MGRFGDFFSRELSRRQVLVFFLFATLVYVLPLILADYPYYDDVWRQMVAGVSLEPNWVGEGRLFTQLFYSALTFTNAAPAIFPLPLLIATLAIAWALTSFTCHFYQHPTFTCCLVSLPLWYSPFFLQNLSYQYDGPTMALSVVAVIHAMIFNHSSRILFWLIPAALIAVALGLYQLSLNVFIGLCCLDLLRVANDKRAKVVWGELIGWRIAQLVLGLLIYRISAYPFMDHRRASLLDWSANPWQQIQLNILQVVENVSTLFHGGLAWVFFGLLMGALGGVFKLASNVVARQEAMWHKCLIGLLCLLTLPLVTLLVSGVALLFRDFNAGARTLMGFSVLLVMLFYLSHLVLASINQWLALLLLVPVLAMLSLSFAYGRVLTVQKALTSSLVASIGYDISSHRQLSEAKLIYLSASYFEQWLPVAAGSLDQLPVLRYIAGINHPMLAENMPSVGIANVLVERDRRNATAVGNQKYTALVDNKFYRIYLIGDYGFIVLREQAPIKTLRW